MTIWVQNVVSFTFFWFSASSGRMAPLTNGRVPGWPDKGLLNFGCLVGETTSGQSRQIKTGAKSSVKLGTEAMTMSAKK